MSIWSTSGKSVAETMRTDSSLYEQYLNTEVVSGTKYLGPRRGEASAMDGTSAVDALTRKKALIGDGNYTVAYLSPVDGVTPLANHVVECNGRSFKTDHMGRINYLDENWIDEEYEQVKFVEQYVHRLTKVCKTNAILQKILCIPYKSVINLCTPGGLVRERVVVTPEEILAVAEIDRVNCLPSVLTMYPPNSMLEAQAYGKLTMIIRKFMPAIKPKSETKPHNQKDPPKTTSGEYAENVRTGEGNRNGSQSLGEE